MCGFAKSPDQKKKDGTKMWHCPYKFPFNYWVVKKDGVIKYTTFDKNKIKLKEGEVLEDAYYKGCPKFNSGDILNNFGQTTVKQEKPHKWENVLDCF